MMLFTVFTGFHYGEAHDWIDFMFTCENLEFLILDGVTLDPAIGFGTRLILGNSISEA